MIARARENGVAVVGAAAGLAVIAWLGLIGFAWTDYDTEASGAFRALTSGHVVGFLVQAPAYAGSLVMRAPFALLPKLWGGGELAVYRAVSAPCLIAAGVLGVWLVARMREAGRGRLARALILGLCVASPIAEAALEIGHPEEILGAVLCVAAVLAARRQHADWAAVLLGLAIANKAWAVLAIGPVLVALDARRVRALVVAGVLAAWLLAPPLIAQAANGHVSSLGATAGGTGTIFQPWQAWWFLGTPSDVVRGSDGQIKPGYRLSPGWLNGVTHPLIAFLAIPLAVLWLRRRRGSRGPDEELLLLALIMSVRCLLDPWDNVYYCLPFLYALVAWEALATRGVPLRSFTVTAAMYFVFHTVTHRVSSPDVQSAAYLLVVVPMTAALAVRVYWPARWRRVFRARPDAGGDLAVAGAR